MAQLSPSIENIMRLKQKPTDGELCLLQFLTAQLDDTYEIYFQPYINGDNPDIVVMRKQSGVLLIEVKDWNLDHYYLDDSNRWRIVKDDSVIRSPFKQLEQYKENLFNLHLEELHQRNVANKKNWATVNCAVYFHKASSSQLKQFLLGKFSADRYEGYRKFIGYFAQLGYDSLNPLDLENLLSRYWLNKRSLYFDETLYNSFRRYLKAPVHQEEEGIQILYTKPQQELIRSEVRPRRKVKGVAGSGKTLVLAKRAVNAYIRTRKPVLILTYNLSLKNYIHDRINDVREQFPWDVFHINNYHQFFKSQANNYGLEINSLGAWQDGEFFESVKDDIRPYDTILIDEIQDYQQEWIDIITRYFTTEETEFVVFGDEKQNIYERELDENNEPVVRTIPGIWNKSLNTSHRFTSAIANIALKFQKLLFAEKYTLDELNAISRIDFESRILEYHFFHLKSDELVVDILFHILKKHGIHPSDVGILSARVEILRELNDIIKSQKHEHTSISFETKEEHASIADNQERLRELRRFRKNHFWMKTGTMKLSTIHSFKGWEIDTLVLLVEGDVPGDHANAELIYTGLTRAKRNLIVMNLGNLTYDSFFRSEIPYVNDVRDKIIF